MDKDKITKMFDGITTTKYIVADTTNEVPTFKRDSNDWVYSLENAGRYDIADVVPYFDKDKYAIIEETNRHRLVKPTIEIEYCSNITRDLTTNDVGLDKEKY